MSSKYLSYSGILVNVILTGPPQLDPLTQLVLSMIKSGKSAKDELIFILKKFMISQSIVEAVIEECIARTYLELSDEGDLKITDRDPDREIDQQVARAIWDPYRRAFLPTVISGDGVIKTSQLVDYCSIYNPLIDLPQGHKRFRFLPTLPTERQNELHPVTSDPNACLIPISDLESILNKSQQQPKDLRSDQNEGLTVQGLTEYQHEGMTDLEINQSPRMLSDEVPTTDHKIDSFDEGKSQVEVFFKRDISVFRPNSDPHDHHLGTELTEAHHLTINDQSYGTIPLYAAIEYTGLNEGDEYNFLVNQSAVTPVLSESNNLWHHWRTDLNSGLAPHDQTTLDDSLKELWDRQRADYQAEREGISVENRREAEALKANACQEIQALIKNKSWIPAELLDLFGEVIYNSSLHDLTSFQRAAMHAISQWIEIFLCEHVIKIPRFDLQRDWKAFDYEQISQKTSELRSKNIKFNPLFIRSFQDMPSDQHPREYLYGKLAPIAPSMNNHQVRMHKPKSRSNLTIGDSLLLFSAALILCEGQTLNVCASAYQRGYELLPLLDRLREDRNSLSHKRDTRRELRMIIEDIKTAWTVCAELSNV